MNKKEHKIMSDDLEEALLHMSVDYPKNLKSESQRIDFLNNQKQLIREDIFQKYSLRTEKGNSLYYINDKRAMLNILDGKPLTLVQILEIEYGFEKDPDEFISIREIVRYIQANHKGNLNSEKLTKLINWHIDKVRFNKKISDLETVNQ